MRFLESVESVVYKCHMRSEESGEQETLPKTAEWLSERKMVPRIGDTIIPLENGPVNKPFCVVHSVIWDTINNEVIILLEKQISRRKNG